MTVFSSGISMYALGRLLQLLFGWSFTASVLISAVVVLLYIFFGGLTGAIYNEVVQFFLMVFGFLPVADSGREGRRRLAGTAARLPPEMVHSWKYMGSPADNAMGVDTFAMVAGLGFVLSFGYWCTDFLIIQRAMAANSMSAARSTPLVGALPKMFIPFIVIVPGMAALALHGMAGSGFQLAAQGRMAFSTTT